MVSLVKKIHTVALLALLSPASLMKTMMLGFATRLVSMEPMGRDLFAGVTAQVALSSVALFAWDEASLAAIMLRLTSRMSSKLPFLLLPVVQLAPLSISLRSLLTTLTHSVTHGMTQLSPQSDLTRYKESTKLLVSKFIETKF